MDKRYDAKFNIDNVIKVEKQPNIIIAFIKAKYNKYCPILDWE